MKLINRRLLTVGVAIGIFICTLIVGVVQVRFLINKILTDQEKAEFIYYDVYSSPDGKTRRGLTVIEANMLINSLPADINAAFENTTTKKAETKYANEIISSKIILTGGNYLKTNTLKLLKGRYFEDEDNKTFAKVCVIHENMYNLLGKKEDITLNIGGQDFKVKGVVTGASIPVSYIPKSINFFEDEIIFMPVNSYFKYFEQITPEQSGSIMNIMVRAPRKYTKETLENMLLLFCAKNEFEKPINVMEEGEQERAALADTLNIVGKILLVASLVLLLAGLNIIYITTANLYDIKKEIGLKIALGAKRTDIMKEIAFDVVLCTLKGGYMGVALYALMFFVLNKFIRDYGALQQLISPMLKQYVEYFRLTFNIQTVIIGMLMSLTLGVLSAIIPAIKSASIDPIEVLRKE